MARFTALQAFLGFLALTSQVVADDPDDGCPASEDAAATDACNQLRESQGDLIILPADDIAYNNAREINWYVWRCSLLIHPAPIGPTVSSLTYSHSYFQVPDGLG
jgi:hypothetical protein